MQETGSEEARAAYLGAGSVLCVSIGFVETTSALARMRKGNRISAAQLRGKRGELERLWRSVDVHTTTDALIEIAARSAEEDALRAYDAVHLAAATSFAQGDEIEFACWDRELREAAARRGFALVPPSL